MDAVAELEHFSLAIGNKRIYVDASLKIPTAGCTVLMGPSGTGKSTLLRTLAGMVQQHPQVCLSGRVQVQGIAESGELLSNVPVLVAQKAEFLLASVWEVLVAHWPERSQRFRSEQKQFIHYYLNQLGQDDLYAAIDQSLLDLPVEMRRRIGIVSKSLAPTSLLMIDEPTANLKDDAQCERILSLIQVLSVRMPVLVTTHNQRHARAIADHVILVASGRVQEQASADQFFNDPQSDSAKAFVRSGSCPEEPLEPFEGDGLVTESDGAAEVFSANRKQLAGKDDGPHLDRCFAGLGQSAERWLESWAHADASAQQPPMPRRFVRPVSDDARVVLSPILGSEQVPVPLLMKLSVRGRGPRGFVWLYEGELAGTPKPGVVGDTAMDLADLRNAGITHLLSLTEVPFPPREAAEFDLSCSALPMPDMGAPSVPEGVRLCRWLDQLLQEGHSVAVHCKAGLGRTGTILAMYAIWRNKGEISAPEAIAKIRSLNAGMIQSVAQETFLERFTDRIKNWAEELQKTA